MFSLMDIVQNFNKQKKQKSKLYFKVMNIIQTSSNDGKNKFGSSIDLSLRLGEKSVSFDQIMQINASVDQ
jgi:hypothetical protein